MGKVSLLGLCLVLFTSISGVAKTIPPKPVSLEGAGFCQNPDALLGLQAVQDLQKGEKIDHIVVLKSIKKTFFLSQGRIFRVFDNVFGAGYSEGHKVRRGDGRTPEGLYFIEAKKSQSSYNLALRVSYPNEADKAFAKKYGLDPGSDIMLHGFPVAPIDGLDPDVVRTVHPLKNWTQGCVAFNDQQIEEIYPLVDVGTPVELCPISSNFSDVASSSHDNSELTPEQAAQISKNLD